MKTDFMLMLQGVPGLTSHSVWNDIRQRLESDSRCRLVPSNSLKEEWFREFCSGLSKVTICKYLSFSFSSLFNVSVVLKDLIDSVSIFGNWSWLVPVYSSLIFITFVFTLQTTLKGEKICLISKLYNLKDDCKLTSVLCDVLHALLCIWLCSLAIMCRRSQ